MSNVNKRFGRLLRTGLNGVKDRQGKTKLGVQKELGDKIGVVPDTIAWYEKGNIPELERLEIMVRYIVEKAYVNYDWADGLLFQAGYPDRNGFLSTIFLAEDGGIAPEGRISHPLETFNAEALNTLRTPGGAVSLKDEFYIERKADSELKQELAKLETTVTIRAPRQTGKTSLLIRGLQDAEQSGSKIVHLDLQGVGEEVLRSKEAFLFHLAQRIYEVFDLDLEQLEHTWKQSKYDPNRKLLNLLEQNILPQAPFVLALDEADQMLYTDYSSDFFGLLRSCHNRRATIDLWTNLKIVLVISTEPYLLISDLKQSPFNVGLKLYLQDFDEKQIRDLNRRHGSPLEEMEITHFKTLLNGQPYLSRLAFYKMVTDDLTWAELADRATHDTGPFGEHLRHHQRLLLNDRKLTEVFKQVIEHNQTTDEKTFSRLLGAGLVTGNKDHCACRCELYYRYFEERL